MTIHNKEITRSNKSSNGARELTKEELLLVSGGSGTIVVDGWRGDDNDWDFWDNNDFYDNGPDYDNGGGGGGGDTDTDTTEEGLSDEEKAAAEAFIAALQADIKKYIDEFGDFTITIGDYKVLASELANSLDALGNLFTVYEGLTLTNDIINGDAGVAEAVGFVAAFAVGAGLAAAGAGPLTVFAASFAAGYLATEGTAIILDQLETAYNAMLAAAVEEIGYEPSDPNWTPLQQELDFILQLLESLGAPPSNPFGDEPWNDWGGNSNDPNYNIP